MIKIMKLEWQKNHLAKYIKTTVISTIVIFAVTAFMAIVSKNQSELMFTDFTTYMSFVNIIIRVVFVIFSAVLLSRLVVDEYKNKTIQVLFTYPVNRLKVMQSKLYLIVGFCFLSILFATLVISCLTLLLNPTLELFPKAMTSQDIVETIPSLALVSLMTACLSLIPLYFGMKKKSTSTTITWGVIIGLLVNATVSDGSSTVNLGQMLVVPVILACVGLLIAYLSFRQINNQDIL
ncbi:ABC transporter permease [Enterococcus alishanensis]|uniref:ABC transporter permease n=1 Tax=Enterococcus alishanensis TaxID=1303817 RepID=A0ABS6TGM0_9ENTE|nr:ABC transporter permease [Enterococcus alishanensis]MBV7391965.1 ABC transporter permease [Enterococcus alishanensis]